MKYLDSGKLFQIVSLIVRKLFMSYRHTLLFDYYFIYGKFYYTDFLNNN